MRTEALSLPANTLRLQAPEVLQAVGARAVRTAVPLPPERQAEVEGEVGQVLASLLTQQLAGSSFGACLDSAFTIARAQVSVATGLMEAAMLQRKFADLGAMPVFQAIRALGAELDALRPAAAPARRWWGLRRPLADVGPAPGAPQRLRDGLAALRAGCEAAAGELEELEARRAALWDAMQKLAASIHFAQVLGERLRIKVDMLKATDAARAAALEEGVLLHVRQNQQEMLSQQVLCTNCYLALELLKKTGREVLGGCSMVAALVEEALADAGEDARREGAEQALQAIAAMDVFRLQAEEAMSQNAATLQGLAQPATLH